MVADLTNLLGIIPNIARDRSLNNAQIVFAVDVAAVVPQRGPSPRSGVPLRGPSDVVGLLRS